MDIQQLLAGSARIDQWKHEISAIVKMVFGFLANVDEAKAFSGEYSLYKQEDDELILFRDARGCLGIKLYRQWQKDGSEKELLCTVPGNEIALDNVGAMHYHLGAFVEAMGEKFPGLYGELRTLYNVGRDNTSYWYQVVLPDEVEETVRFKKRSGHKSLLPLKAQVWIFLEGPMSGEKVYDGEADIQFRVVEHCCHIHDAYGDLAEQEHVMVLKPQDDVSEDIQNFTRLLRANGWEKSDY